MKRLETISGYLSLGFDARAGGRPRAIRAGAVVAADSATRRDQSRRTCEDGVALPVCSICSEPRAAGQWSGAGHAEAEETIVLDVLDRTGILVHPGYFFDFEREAFLVISLLPEPALFAGMLTPVASFAVSRLSMMQIRKAGISFRCFLSVNPQLGRRRDRRYPRFPPSGCIAPSTVLQILPINEMPLGIVALFGAERDGHRSAVHHAGRWRTLR